MKVFFAWITKSAIGCSQLFLFIGTLNNTQFENFNMCLQIFIRAFHHFRWLGRGGANDPDFSVDLGRSRATFRTTEILYIFRRNCYTSQGDPDSRFPYLTPSPFRTEFHNRKLVSPTAWEKWPFPWIIYERSGLRTVAMDQGPDFWNFVWIA